MFWAHAAVMAVHSRACVGTYVAIASVCCRSPSHARWRFALSCGNRPCRSVCRNVVCAALCVIAIFAGVHPRPWYRSVRFVVVRVRLYPAGIGAGRFQFGLGLAQSPAAGCLAALDPRAGLALGWRVSTVGAPSRHHPCVDDGRGWRFDRGGALAQPSAHAKSSGRLSANAPGHVAQRHGVSATAVVI